MGVQLHQDGDGTLRLRDDKSGLDMDILGGPDSTQGVSGGTASVSLRWGADLRVKVPYKGGVDTAGGILQWKNPFPYAILVKDITLYNDTSSAVACSISVGIAATTVGATLSANLIDTLSVNAGLGPFDNITDKGTNGKSRQVLAANNYLTMSTTTGASAGMSGRALIEMLLL